MSIHQMSARVLIRPMRASDIGAVLRLQAEAYHEVVLETAAEFQHKLTFCPSGCFVAEAADGVCGYVFSHPGRWLQPPAIGAALDATVPADCWYLHDLVVAERARGQRLAQRLLAQVQQCAQAAGFDRMALTALKQAVGYWQACGFEPVSAGRPLQGKLQQYGDGARYMAQAV